MYPQPDEPDQTSADTPSNNGAGGGEEQDETKMGGETALLPKSILGGKDFQPGQEVVLKIVGMHEDEVEVQYAPEKAGDEEESDAPESMGGGSSSEMDKAQGKLASMGGGGGGY